MNADLRLQQITGHQQHLREQAAAERLARISRCAALPFEPADALARAIHTMRRLVASLA